MKHQYRISATAISDLELIWKYTSAKWSVEQADRYYKLIINEIEFLTTNLYIGKSIDFIKIGYWCSSVKSHLIFYKIADDHVVEVIRILHQSMNVDEALFR